MLKQLGPCITMLLGPLYQAELYETEVLGWLLFSSAGKCQRELWFTDTATGRRLTHCGMEVVSP